jgi:hypothetical protein
MPGHLAPHHAALRGWVPTLVIRMTRFCTMAAPGLPFGDPFGELAGALQPYRAFAGTLLAPYRRKDAFFGGIFGLLSGALTQDSNADVISSPATVALQIRPRTCKH